MILHTDDPDTGPETVPTDHAPLEGEPRKPLYPQRHFTGNDDGPSATLTMAVLLVAICAVLVMLAVPVRG